MGGCAVAGHSLNGGHRRVLCASRLPKISAMLAFQQCFMFHSRETLKHNLKRSASLVPWTDGLAEWQAFVLPALFGLPF